MTLFPRTSKNAVLITGGAGFIGCNLAAALVRQGRNVHVYDSFSRAGARENAHWLTRTCGERVQIEAADVRDADAIRGAVACASAVIHLAAQVAVTTSLERPAEDFEVNARGTLNVLEALRELNPAAPLLFASTNKVYGSLFDPAAMRRVGTRCEPSSPLARSGISEDAPLDFHSPYGCSKGAADQYVRDYARVFGLCTIVLRMSCIYGPRQFGNEDQGWIAHFMLQAVHNRLITIYGDGLQVRDALHIDDAAAAWLAVLGEAETLRGRVFNLGGGPSTTISLLELLDAIAQLRREHPRVTRAAMRPGDQPWYVSDTTALRAATGWAPKIELSEGLRSLAHWLEARFGMEQPARAGVRA